MSEQRRPVRGHSCCRACQGWSWKRGRRMLAMWAVAPMVAALVVGCGRARGASPPLPAGSGRAPVSSTTTLSSPQTIYLTMDILGSFKLGPDGKYHDAFSPSSLQVPAGDHVVLTIYNWDSMPHTFTVPRLNINVTTVSRVKKGDPGVTIVKFSVPHGLGTYSFLCTIPCDSDNHDWSMGKLGYMNGTLTAVPV